MPKYLVSLEIDIDIEMEASDEEIALMKAEHEILEECSDCIEVELLEEDEDDG